MRKKTIYSFYAIEKPDWNPLNYFRCWEGFILRYNFRYYTPFSPSFYSVEKALLWKQKNGSFFEQRGVTFQMFINNHPYSDNVYQPQEVEIIK